MVGDRGEPPGYLVIGHVTHDLTPEGRRPGGTAVFAALTAQRLGEAVAVVTSAGADFDFAAALPGIAVACKPARATTTFENVLVAGRRRQRLHARAAGLAGADVPPAWWGARIVHLAPLAGELSPTLGALFPTSLLGVTAQGWLRDWDAAGRVRQSAWPEAGAVLGRATATVLSAEDVGEDERLIAAYAAAARLLVVTRGARGCTVYCRGTMSDVPAFATTVVDSTGAGDVFAAAYFIALARGADPVVAARFANGAASFAVERPGTAGIATVRAIEKRLARG